MAGPVAVTHGGSTQGATTDSILQQRGDWAVHVKISDPSKRKLVWVIEWPTNKAKGVRAHAIVIYAEPGQDLCSASWLQSHMRAVQASVLTPCPPPSWASPPAKFKTTATRSKFLACKKKEWENALEDATFRAYIATYRPGTVTNPQYGESGIFKHLIAGLESSTLRDVRRHANEVEHKQRIQDGYESTITPGASCTECKEAMTAARTEVESGTYRERNLNAADNRNQLASQSASLDLAHGHRHCAAYVCVRAHTHRGCMLPHLPCACASQLASTRRSAASPSQRCARPS